LAFDVFGYGVGNLGVAMFDLGNPSNAQIVSAVGTLFAILTSIISLAVSIFSLWRQREHDRNSVKPLPQIIFGDYEETLEVSIENAGIGPFIVNQVQVEHKLSHDIQSSVIAQMRDLPPGYFWTTFTDHIEGRAIPAQDRLVLLKLSQPDDEIAALSFNALRNDVRTQLGYLVITVTGTDVYGTTLPATKRHLDWFHRLIFVGPNRAADSQ
jgi:hypothetical protein